MATLYPNPDQDPTGWIEALTARLQASTLGAESALLEIETAWGEVTDAALYEFPDGVPAWVRGLILRLAAETYSSPTGARKESLAIDDFRVGYAVSTTDTRLPGQLTDDERRKLRLKFGPDPVTSVLLVSDADVACAAAPSWLWCQ